MECVMNATIGGWERMDETRRALRRNVSEARHNNSSSALAGWLAGRPAPICLLPLGLSAEGLTTVPEAASPLGRLRPPDQRDAQLSSTLPFN